MLYAQLVTMVAKTIGVPASLLLAICTYESGLNNVLVPHDHGSPSYGLCQIKKDTAISLGYQDNSEPDGVMEPFDAIPGAMKPMSKPTGLMVPIVNIKYAALYLKMQLERYDGDWCKAVAAYNSGTYNPSKQNPNIPRNIKYIKQIVLRLDDEHKDFLICGPRKD